MKNTRSLLLSILSLIFPVLALADAPPAPIYACVHKSSQQVRFVAVDVACTQNETRMTINAAGVQGPQGDAGPQGPKGDLGPQGPKGDPGAGLNTGGISGQAISCGGPLVGALAFLPGYSFTAVTGAGGNFLLSYVPPGAYNLMVEAMGGGATAGPAVTVVAGQTASAGVINVTSFQSDPANCGTCGNACATGQVCTNGQCVLICSAGSTNCGGVCRNLTFDPSNCGACGHACGSAMSCNSGTCTCAAGFRDCDNNPANGCEINITVDRNNCGACGIVCNGTCSGGVCITSCGDGIQNGQETDRDCGGPQCASCSTGKHCNVGSDCQSGACGGGVCLAPQGSACSSPSQCATGFCVDGFCANQACNTTCFAASSSLTGQANGTCAPVVRGVQDPDTCNNSSVACDGSGRCLLRPGQPCTSSSQCVSGSCNLFTGCN